MEGYKDMLGVTLTILCCFLNDFARHKILLVHVVCLNLSAQHKTLLVFPCQLSLAINIWRHREL
jgi:hypothetical protein